MRYTASHVGSLGEVRIDVASNCYSDALPLLQQIWFRKLPVDFQSPTLALAAAILTADYCGSVFDFAGVKLGEDYAEAIRTVLGGSVIVQNVDGLNRALTTGELDIVVGRAGQPLPAVTPSDATPVVRLDWSGDFVDRGTATSAGFFFGAVQTNAHHFSNDARVSIATALLFGKEKCRDIYVAEPARNWTQVSSALHGIGVGIRSR